MTALLEAHGGVDTWLKYRSVSAHLKQGGALWALKGKQGVLDDVHVTVGTTRQWASHYPFGTAGIRSSFEKDLIVLERDDKTVVAKDTQPRLSFEGHTLQTPWTDLQLAFFAGCAMWTYLNVLFLLRWPGVGVAAPEPWQERGETWQRMAVTYPA